MANHLQTKKRIRQTLKRKVRNGSIKSWTRKTITKVRVAIDAGNAEDAGVALKTAVQNIDKLVTKDIMNRKTASRAISRLTKAVNKLSA